MNSARNKTTTGIYHKCSEPQATEGEVMGEGSLVNFKISDGVFGQKVYHKKSDEVIVDRNFKALKRL